MPACGQVEYFGQTQLSIILRNNSREKLLVELLTLRFQSDAGAASIYEETECSLELQPEGLWEQVVTITPDLSYLTNTNIFDVMVTYRVDTGQGLSAKKFEIHRGSYLIIRTPARQLGQVFISFRQPDNLALARILERLALRAGFSPYLAIRDPRTGTLLWDKIERAIKASVATFVIWTKNTPWGRGVEREVALSRSCRVPVVLLIERDVALRTLFNDSVEYQPFELENTVPSFSAAVTARRKILLEIIRGLTTTRYGNG